MPWSDTALPFQKSERFLSYPLYHWAEDRIRAHVFLCVLALQIERLMRRRLQSVSVGKARERIHRIKTGELRVGSVMIRTLTRTTEEQLNLLKSLDAPPPQMAKAVSL